MNCDVFGLGKISKKVKALLWYHAKGTFSPITGTRNRYETLRNNWSGINSPKSDFFS